MHSPIAAAAALVLCAAGLAAGRPAAQAIGPCTTLSQSATKWDVVDLGLSASYDSNSGGDTSESSDDGANAASISFQLANAAVAYRANCSAQSTDVASDFFDGKQEYSCSVPADAKGLGDKATFTFSRRTGRLSIKQMWRCAKDLSGFKAEGGVALNLTCGDAPASRANPPPVRTQAPTAVKAPCHRNSTVSVPMESLGGFA
ncbi:hypothetical protein JDV02_004071 [Purpureocillium takamizusanense]|uniref:AA1-like domain-containing protein n=1 Tax=Purpureocillium takamizusanense TaxID=2060973 RepID=A0A9Q8V916_9HYPO|nr:uncharacterized protein JDV02_004071 [Purpureocillium takamizusanense]UNI17750.1 hypothetical protein JDV02_004071 [Purpureocillium takamizusanense]